MLYRIDLDKDEESTQLVKQVLEALAKRFSYGQVELDTTVHNLSRISKIYGTLAGKGDSTRERPHRLAQLLSVPSELIVVGRELLEKVATLMPPANGSAASGPGAAAVDELRRRITGYGLVIRS